MRISDGLIVLLGSQGLGAPEWRQCSAEEDQLFEADSAFCADAGVDGGSSVDDVNDSTSVRWKVNVVPSVVVPPTPITTSAPFVCRMNGPPSSAVEPLLRTVIVVASIDATTPAAALRKWSSVALYATS